MKMGWQTWVIIILVALAYYQYTSPEKAHGFLEPVFSPAQNFIQNNNPMGEKKETTEESNCPDTDNPVCGVDGITYKNICYATEAQVLEVTMGAC